MNKLSCGTIFTGAGASGKSQNPEEHHVRISTAIEAVKYTSPLQNMKYKWRLLLFSITVKYKLSMSSIVVTKTSRGLRFSIYNRWENRTVVIPSTWSRVASLNQSISTTKV